MAVRQSFWDERKQLLELASDIIKVSGKAALLVQRDLKDESQLAIDEAMLLLGKMVCECQIVALERVKSEEDIHVELEALKDWHKIFDLID